MPRRYDIRVAHAVERRPYRFLACVRLSALLVHGVQPGLSMGVLSRGLEWALNLNPAPARKALLVTGSAVATPAGLSHHTQNLQEMVTQAFCLNRTLALSSKVLVLGAAGVVCVC